MGNTMTIWSQVCLGTGTGLGWSYLSNTVPVRVTVGSEVGDLSEHSSSSEVTQTYEF
jgi:hypothetical protein